MVKKFPGKPRNFYLFFYFSIVKRLDFSIITHKLMFGCSYGAQTIPLSELSVGPGENIWERFRLK